jgi:tetratricopeptide (TPR) repeat protein
MLLDLLANNNWERPIYFAITTGSGSYIGLQKYFQLEGLAYRLMPFEANSPDGQTGRVNTEIMYKNLVENFQWGGMEEHHIYMNENNRRMCMNLRNNFARLADNLTREGKKDKAIAVLDRCLEVMPDHNVPYDYFIMPVAEAYYRAGAKDKGNELVKHLFSSYEQESNYYFSLDDDRFKQIQQKSQQALSILYRLSTIVKQSSGDTELTKDLETRFQTLQTEFGARQQS